MVLPAALYDRPTSTSRTVIAGCFTCNGTDALWTHAGAQGTAARHHDATKHATWCDVILSARDDRQVDLEDAIATVGADA